MYPLIYRLHFLIVLEVNLGHVILIIMYLFEHSTVSSVITLSSYNS